MKVMTKALRVLLLALVLGTGALPAASPAFADVADGDGDSDDDDGDCSIGGAPTRDVGLGFGMLGAGLLALVVRRRRRG